MLAGGQAGGQAAAAAAAAALVQSRPKVRFPVEAQFCGKANENTQRERPMRPTGTTFARAARSCRGCAPWITPWGKKVAGPPATRGGNKLMGARQSVGQHPLLQGKGMASIVGSIMEPEASTQF